MPWQSGVPVRTDGTRSGTTVWQTADQAGVDIISPDHDTHDQDVADMIGDTIHKGGQNTVTANINWGGFKLENLGDGTAAGDAVNKGQLDTGLNGKIGAVVEDTSPVLGGELQAPFNITGTQAGGLLRVQGQSGGEMTAGGNNVALTPGSGGMVILHGVNWPTVAPVVGQQLTATATDTASWQTVVGVSDQFAVAVGGNTERALSALTPAITGTVESIKLVLTCTTPDIGYAVGDELHEATIDWTQNQLGYQTYRSGTNVGVQIAVNGLIGVTKGSGALSGLTMTSWTGQLRVRAYVT